MALFLSSLPAARPAEDRDAKVQNDRREVEAGGHWIYNDLPKAFAEARQTGKPLLVVFRCVPCKACQGFDGRVVGYDKQLEDVLDKFVRARVVYANNMDLSLFQFDYDLSFAAFFMNGDKTIYGRYGSRSETEKAEKDISMEGFRKAMEGALELHAKYPANKESFAKKTGPAVIPGAPEEYPSLKGKFKAAPDYEGKVARTCIHCHMVREAQRLLPWNSGKHLPDEALFPYPMPDALGLGLDPAERAVVSTVAPGSPGGKAGFKPGDSIESLNGQPILSIADVSWVLHKLSPGERLTARIKNAEGAASRSFDLPEDWRRAGDISWRPTSWDLRRIATGGLVLKTVPQEERRKMRLPEPSVGLVVSYVGQFGDHAVGKKAGFQKDDVILAIDGDKNPMTESQLFARVLQSKKTGDKLAITVLRAGEAQELTMPVQ